MSDTHIKINAVTPRVQYTGNGVTTTFPYEFAIFDETDMVVYVGDDIIESGYTVTGAGETEGGTVVFDTAPDDGAKITLLRNVPIERITDFQEGGTFRPKNLNDEFDRQTAFVQQVQETLDRAVKVGPTSDVEPEQVLTQVERIYSSIDNVDAVADNETNINSVADNETNINTCASNIAAIADAPNQAAAAASSATASEESAALSAQYANDKINQTHISNCITEIPQDIKLELNNSTLTLKAGSTVYVPNGNGVFEKKMTTSDLSKNTSGDSLSTGTYMLFVNSALSRIDVWPLDKVVSGSTDSLAGTTYHTWYDTTNNVINRYTNSGSTVNWTCALPLAIVTITNSFVTSIDKVFNGFGYIGSTVFALPGVKGLISDGRNADGTLKSTEFTTNNVLINTVGNSTSNMYVLLNATGISCLDTSNIEYKEKENLVYNTAQSWIEYSCICCNLYRTSGKITSLTPKTVFHALDWNDKGIIAGWSMPSSKYIDLTLGASGANYTMPKDGYICLGAVFDAQGYVYLYRATTPRYGITIPYNANQWVDVCLNVKKGDVIIVQYNGNATVQYFNFICVQGEV